MQRYYAPSTGGFHIEGQTIPVDAVTISLDEHLALLEAEDRGMAILPAPDGRPMAVAPAGPTIGEVGIAKAREIRAGFDTALSGVLAGADATANGVAVGSALMAVTDPQGLEYLVERLTARRVELEQTLLAALASEEPVTGVQAIAVGYPT